MFAVWGIIHTLYITKGEATISDKKSEQQSVHDGHRDRLRQRFLRQGLEGFEPHTVLELLLFYARPRCDTNLIAHDLLKHFGNVAAVMDAPIEEIAAVNGMGEKSAMLLKMIPELCGYYLSSRSAAGDILDSTEKAGKYLMPRFFGKTNEEVWLVALDDKRKVLRCGKVGEEGVVNAVRITVRNVVAEAVKANATAIIIAHNHPGGLALPSAADKQLTRQLFQALKYINVALLDHIVVADGDFVSMADSGYLELIGREEFA